MAGQSGLLLGTQAPVMTPSDIELPRLVPPVLFACISCILCYVSCFSTSLLLGASVAYSVMRLALFSTCMLTLAGKSGRAGREGGEGRQWVQYLASVASEGVTHSAGGDIPHA